MLEITGNVLSIDKVYNAVRDPEAGGIVIFLGTVRNRTDDKAVFRLEYEAYEPMAMKQIAKIEDEVRSRWNIKRMHVVHRTGRLEIGDIAVIIGISSAHRHEAFSACRYVIDRVKQDVPIWKKEYFEDGSIWVEGENASPGMEKYV